MVNVIVLRMTQNCLQGLCIAILCLTLYWAAFLIMPYKEIQLKAAFLLEIEERAPHLARTVSIFLLYMG